uniref:Choline transporter-like protein n=1 Tax=Anolis carolinensis TaxID=28377 RepID=G1KKL2_ANOCA
MSLHGAGADRGSSSALSLGWIRTGDLQVSNPTFRSCTDVICCAIFAVFLFGYIIVGIVAWLYGDPRQVIYPRNSTGSYCGIGGNRDKPFLLYFNLIKCATTVNILAAAMNGLQCPTTQICVSSCTDKFWVVPPNAFFPPYQHPSKIWDQMLCQPRIDLKTTNLTIRDIIQKELCPEFTLPTQPILNRCFPTFNISEAENFTLTGKTVNETIEDIKLGAEQLIKSLDAKNIGLKIFEDFTRSWYWILIKQNINQINGVLFHSAMYLLCMHMISLKKVNFLNVAHCILPGFAFCWNWVLCQRDTTGLNVWGKPLPLTLTTTNSSILYFPYHHTSPQQLIILCVVEVILLLTLLFLRKRIFIALALIREASRAIGHMMSTLFYPILTFILLVICVAYWGMTALYLATSGIPLYRLTAPNNTAPGCERISGNQSCNPLKFNASEYLPCSAECIFYKYNDEGLIQQNLFNLQIYNILGFLWCINFVIALGQCVLAGAFASYYWAFHKPRDIPLCAVCSAFIRTLRYHIGSLAFGALILTIVQVIRIILEYLDHKLKDSVNPVARCILCCLKCCFWCLEEFIKYLNRNAYIMIAIYGKNFCVSAKNAFKLLMRNVVRVVVLDKITDLLLLFGKLLVVGGVGVFAFFFFTGRIPIHDSRFQSPTLNYYWLPIFTVVVGSYLIAQGFFSVYSMCVDTLFLCFLEDLERNDGSSEKPYFMDKSLMKILNKKNKEG